MRECVRLCASGDSPNWFVTRLEVLDVGTGRSYLFPCNQWIGRDKVRVGCLPEAKLQLEQVEWSRQGGVNWRALLLVPGPALSWIMINATDAWQRRRRRCGCSAFRC